MLHHPCKHGLNNSGLWLACNDGLPFASLLGLGPSLPSIVFLFGLPLSLTLRSCHSGLSRYVIYGFIIARMGLLLSVFPRNNKCHAVRNILVRLCHLVTDILRSANTLFLCSGLGLVVSCLTTKSCVPSSIPATGDC